MANGNSDKYQRTFVSPATPEKARWLDRPNQVDQSRFS